MDPADGVETTEPAAPAHRDWKPHRRRSRFGVRPVVRVLALTSLSLVLLFSMVLPRFPCGCRVNANESAAIATLKNLASGQEQFRAGAFVDRDGDLAGEYGYFAELAGAVSLPDAEANDSPSDDRSGPEDEVRGRLATPVLSRAFGKLRSGCVRRSGYRFRIYLPGPGGSWLPEARGGGRFSGGGVPVDPNGAEHRWLVYAWPIVHDGERRGRRSFVCDETGEVRATRMPLLLDHGDRGPQAGVAGFRFDGAAWVPAANTVDALGDVWVCVQ